MTDPLMEKFQDHARQLREALADLDVWHQQVAQVVRVVRQVFDAGGTVYTAGNGGSATLAQHLSDEMVGRFRTNRQPLPVIALTADSAVLTCIGNDFGYDQVFRRQLEALGREGDVFIAYSTSGNSPNILEACEQAKKQSMTVVGFSGPSGKLKEIADFVVVSPAKTTERIQELDLHAIHLICEAFEPNN